VLLRQRRVGHPFRHWLSFLIPAFVKEPTALAGNEQDGMRAPASQQGRRGDCMTTGQIECNRLQVWVRARATSSVVVVVLVTHENAQDFKARSAAKEHTNKCKATVAIQASAGLTLGSVSRQHVQSSLVRLFFFFWVLNPLPRPLGRYCMRSGCLSYF